MSLYDTTDISIIQRRKRRKKKVTEEVFKHADDSCYFNGAKYPRESYPRIFSPDELILDNKLNDDRPCFIFPDGHIFIETYSPFFDKVIEFINSIAEPCSRPKHMQEFQLNEYLIYSSITLGLSVDEIIKTLELISKNKITDELKNKIKECNNKIDKARILLKNDKFYIESTDIDVLYDMASKFSSNNTIKDHLVFPESKSENTISYKEFEFIKVDKDEVEKYNKSLIDNGLNSSVSYLSSDIERRPKLSVNFYRFEISEAAVSEVRKISIEDKLFLSDEYDYTDDTELSNMRIEFKDLACVRPYQEKAISKIFVGNRARSGIIVLPCGSGKTLVGVLAITRLKKSSIVVCNSIIPVEQWDTHFRRYTDTSRIRIVKFTSKEKSDLPLNDEPCIVITTYNMLVTDTNRAEKSKHILEQIRSRTWGMIVLDEVQETAAEERRKSVDIKVKCRIGLTATLVREDELISDLRFLVGPKLYEADWQSLASKGYIANVKCFEVFCKMPPCFLEEYMSNNSDAISKSYIAASNPNKMNIAFSLIKYHERRGDKVLVFIDIINLLLYIGDTFKYHTIYGKTSKNMRENILEKFRKNKINVIIISSVGDKAIDLPDANVLIQLSSKHGSQLAESQRLGRVLRPKYGKSEDGYTAFFYSLVSMDTKEVYFSKKRQRFLIDQGYSYEPIDDPETRYQDYIKADLDNKYNPEARWKQDNEIPFKDERSKKERLHAIKTSRERVMFEELPDEVPLHNPGIYAINVR